jgi:hypothetical protein
MLDVAPEKIKAFTAQYQNDPLRWINILHSSDIIAYPIQSSINAELMPNIFFRDKYIWADANGGESMARMLGQWQAAMSIAVSDAHCSYWNSPGVARLIASNILNDREAIDSPKISTS